MKYNVLLVGVGGMGILTASRLIANASIIEEKNVIMSEIHGLSQRGGVVYTMVRLGDVSSPLIKKGSVDSLIALESTESLRYLNTLASDASIIVNRNLVTPPLVTAGMGESLALPTVEEKLKSFSDNLAIVPALKAAEEIGNPIIQNTILIGVFFSHTDCPLNVKSGEKAIKKHFSGKQEKIINLNLQAFNQGLEMGQKIFS